MGVTAGGAVVERLIVGELGFSLLNKYWQRMFLVKAYSESANMKNKRRRLRVSKSKQKEKLCNLEAVGHPVRHHTTTESASTALLLARIHLTSPLAVPATAPKSVLLEPPQPCEACWQNIRMTNTRTMSGTRGEHPGRVRLNEAKTE